jgi:dienelactone hydrolase
VKNIKSSSLLIISIVIFALLSVSCASYQSVNFKSAPVAEDSVALKGNLYKPEGEGPFPAVVVLHGCAGIDDHFIAWAEQLVKWGYMALIVDSFGPRGVNRVCGESYRVPDIERAADAYGAAIYLKQLPYVDGKNIGLIGFSHGGWTGLRAVQKNFPYAVNMETIPFKAAVLFYPSCYYAQDEYIAIPTLILIGSKDDWTPADRCVELDKVVSNPEMLELVVYDGAYHDFDRQKQGYRTYLGHVLKYDYEATKDAKERTKAFFDKHLLGN